MMFLGHVFLCGRLHFWGVCGTDSRCIFFGGGVSNLHFGISWKMKSPEIENIIMLIVQKINKAFERIVDSQGTIRIMALKYL